MFRVVDVFDVRENLASVDWSLFEEEEEEPEAARSRSARFRREMEDEALFLLVDLTRGLALSNEDIVSCVYLM